MNGIPVSRMRFLARTSRCAVVAGATAKAEAMAAASTPQNRLQHQRGTDVGGDGRVGAHQHEFEPTVGNRRGVRHLPGDVVALGPWPGEPVDG